MIYRGHIIDKETSRDGTAVKVFNDKREWVHTCASEAEAFAWVDVERKKQLKQIVKGK